MAKFILNLDGPLLKLPDSISSASFDYVGRYQLIAEIITRYFGKGAAKLSVLDVGGLGSILDQLIPVKTTILDNEAEDGVTDKQQTNGDGADMNSIDDNSYDAVVTSDTLEHIPPQDRANFIKELIRVSKDLVVLCAPFGDHDAAKEEADLQEFYTGLSGEPHRWLAEHAEYGLPIEKEIVSYIPKTVASYITIHHSSPRLWRDLLAINLLANDINNPAIYLRAEAINRKYNKEGLFKDFTENSYRTFIIISKSKEIQFTPPATGLQPAQTADILEMISDFYIEVFKNFKQVPSVDALSTKLNDVTAQHEALNNTYNYMYNSKTWRYTAPVRRSVRKIRNLKQAKETEREQ